MIPRHHMAAIVIVVLATTAAASWLLLFAAPALFNAHRDAAAGLAAAIVLGVPAGVAWGGTRLWAALSPEDDDDD